MKFDNTCTAYDTQMTPILTSFQNDRNICRFLIIIYLRKSPFSLTIRQRNQLQVCRWFQQIAQVKTFEMKTTRLAGQVFGPNASPRKTDFFFFCQFSSSASRLQCYNNRSFQYWFYFTIVYFYRSFLLPPSIISWKHNTFIQISIQIARSFLSSKIVVLINNRGTNNISDLTYNWPPPISSVK